MKQHCMAAFNRVFSVFLFLCRLAKEEIAYITEAKQQEEKIERLKTEAADDYVIKKQVHFASLMLYSNYVS